MAEIIKISSSQNVKSNIQNLNRQIAPDALFDLTNALTPVKARTQVETDQKGTAQQSLLQELNRTILEPLLTATGSQSGKLRELLLLAQLFDVSWGKISDTFVSKLFVNPDELLGELMKQDKNATVFHGEIFNSLRMLSTVKGQPQLTNAIADILKFFDCFVNQNNSLKTIATQGENLASQLPQKAAALLSELNTQLNTLVEAATTEPKTSAAANKTIPAPIFPWQAAESAVETPSVTVSTGEAMPEEAKTPPEKTAAQIALPTDAAEVTEENPEGNVKRPGFPVLNADGEELISSETLADGTKRVKANIQGGQAAGETLQKAEGDVQKQLQSFLKNEYVPQLTQLVKQYPGSAWLRNSVMDMIHHVVRYDKSDLVNLDDAAVKLGEILKPLTSINEQGVQELKSLLLTTAVEAESQEYEGVDMADLLAKALEKGSPEKINRVGHALLSYMVQNESPVLPFVYFMIPIKFMDENVYGEFLIDRECKNKKGQAKEATNIFFTIQSDEFGSFEVDLLAKDKFIDLDIKCPQALLDTIRDTRTGLRDIIEDQGYRLSNYNVGIFKESRTILERFPELTQRKVGVDVKI